MGCYGSYKHDRTCNLCEMVQLKIYCECIRLNELEKNNRIQLLDIMNNCKYYDCEIDNRDRIDVCNKHKDKYGNVNYCSPTLECEQYKKE
jgi:hypothetical protein